MVTPTSKLRLGVFTWNVNSRRPDDHSKLEKWLIEAPRQKLQEKQPSDAAPPFDVYVVGLQEAVPKDLLRRKADKERDKLSEKWISKLSAVLSTKGNYSLFASEKGLGIFVFVYIRDSLQVLQIKEMSRDKVLTGFEVKGHKGAVGIRFSALGISMCFLCCHLDAGLGMDRCLQRNEDFHNIAQNINFSRGGRVPDHELVFIFGSLNYRLCGDRTGKELVAVLKEQGSGALTEGDELRRQQLLGDAFLGFEEMELSFPPTYKLKVGSDSYDRTEQLAWTDRVTYREREPRHMDDPNENLNHRRKRKSFGLVYGRAELKTSDHRPVFAVFDIFSEAVSIDGKDRSNAINSGPPSYVTDLDNLPEETEDENGQRITRDPPERYAPRGPRAYPGQHRSPSYHNAHAHGRGVSTNANIYPSLGDKQGFPGGVVPPSPPGMGLPYPGGQPMYPNHQLGGAQYVAGPPNGIPYGYHYPSGQMAGGQYPSNGPVVHSQYIGQMPMNGAHIGGVQGHNGQLDRGLVAGGGAHATGHPPGTAIISSNPDGAQRRDGLPQEFIDGLLGNLKQIASDTIAGAIPGAKSAGKPMQTSPQEPDKKDGIPQEFLDKLMGDLTNIAKDAIADAVPGGNLAKSDGKPNKSAPQQPRQSDKRDGLPQEFLDTLMGGLTDIAKDAIAGAVPGGKTEGKPNKSAPQQAARKDGLPQEFVDQLLGGLKGLATDAINQAIPGGNKTDSTPAGRVPARYRSQRMREESYPQHSGVPAILREASLYAEQEFALHPAKRFLDECHMLDDMEGMDYLQYH